MTTDFRQMLPHKAQRNELRVHWSAGYPMRVTDYRYSALGSIEIRDGRYTVYDNRYSWHSTHESLEEALGQFWSMDSIEVA